MPLVPGVRLGSYEIVAPVGSGGMGEVYQARDARLGRDVAIKVLPSEVAADPERLARFEREARVLASLNHPNIATLHGFESEGSVRFLVMELVPGETLAERLIPGRLPAAEALPIFLQIAEGLEAAHEAGVVHRDLKPANVKITPEGRVKILDFGLAKAVAAAATGSADPAESPTLTALATQRGEIMGTAAYMSPEQARGKPVDRRADIWAFGCVLYESLAGTRPFLGETITDVLAAIVKDEPDWTALPDDVPPTAAELIRRCLEKDARNRLRDIGEARLGIARALGRETASGSLRVAAAATPISGPVAVAPSPDKGSLRLTIGVTLALLLGAAGGAAVVLGLGQRGAPNAKGELARLVLEAPPGVFVQWPGITPDGRTVVYFGAPKTSSDDRPTDTRLYTRPIGAWESRPLEGTDGAVAFAFSPDGKWVAAAASIGAGSTKRRIIKIPLDGTAPPLTLAEWSDDWNNSVAWMPDGDLLVSASASGSLIRIHTDGSGPSEPIKVQMTMPPGGLNVWDALPSGRVLATVSSWEGGGYHDKTLAVDPKTGEVQTLVEEGANPRWSASGHLLFTRRDTLLAAPFASGTGVPGPPVAIASGLRLVGEGAGAWFDISTTGVLVYQPGGLVATGRRLAMVDPTGKVTPWSTDRLPFVGSADVAPDGRRLAVTVMRDDWFYTIWTSELDRPQLRLLAAEPQMDCDRPFWFPSSDRVLYTCTGKEDRAGIYVSAATGGGARRVLRLESSADFQRVTSISPDGKWAILERTQEGLARLLLLPLGAEGVEQPESAAKQLLPSDSLASGASFSPDGRWIAYVARGSGRTEIQIRPFAPDGTLGPATFVGVSPSTVVYWTGLDRDGAPVLTYAETRDRLVSVTVRGGPSVSISEPRPAFDLSKIEPGINGITPLPGGRLLITQQSEEEMGTAKVLVVLNWFDELRRLAPAH
jgi:Tol biopolymer transport system component